MPLAALVKDCTLAESVEYVVHGAHTATDSFLTAITYRMFELAYILNSLRI